MSKAFTLQLINPAATGPVTNVIYTGLSGGNALNLIIGNNSGFDMTIGGSSTGKFLDVLISDNILNAEAAAALHVKAPWSIASFIPPSKSGEAYTFKLAPPAGGVPLPNNGTITIELNTLEPDAKGTAQLQVQYQFDTQGDSLHLSASLSVIGGINPKLAQLFGDNAPLRFSYYVNNSDSEAPIMVSSSPVTPANELENRLHLNVVFQETMRPAFRLDDNNGYLVNGWDANNPPAFRVFFPYFSVNEKLPAMLDLTDALQPADPHYNVITSAWNIAGALDAENAKITKNDFWQIGLDPLSPEPVWAAQPMPGNTHLFTAVMGASGQPGPFLDLFFSHIFSCLPIDPANPATVLYFQWLNFPGFNDGIAAFALEKRDKLVIPEFNCEIVRSAAGTYLQMTWTANNAAYCLVNGDDNHLPASRDFNHPYKRAVTAAQPLLSSYTLTAVAADGLTTITRTVKLKWQLNNALQSPALDAAGLFQITPDGKKLFYGDANGIKCFDPNTLQPLPFEAPASVAANVVITPDSKTFFFTTMDGKVNGYNIQTQQLTPGSGYDFSGGSVAPFSIIALSKDNKKLILGTQLASVNNKNEGANTLVIVDTNNLRPVMPTITLPETPLQVAVGPNTGNVYVALSDENSNGSVIVLDGETFARLPFSPIALRYPGMLALSPDESMLYVISISDVELTYFVLSQIDTQTMQLVNQLNIDYGFFPLTEAFLGFPLASLYVSPDNTTLFISGMTIEAMKNKDPNEATIGIFAALHTDSLQERSWSPLAKGNILFSNVTLLPDGSRMIAAGSLNLMQGNKPPIYLNAFDPVFQ
ncbi:YncE family protein [Chitinophaga ginsengisoli]|uniref:Uncharacterized protein n=1 Tax=Chitinophaga ginsengisoli TaxID=363837 RepID=A0A2P8G4X7_9BACT|nr:hypothetical protein [Chitinophaga ginsengisoli]PSL29017.1 hypothetical protein CLV42_107163 [Chitinophaga ginsengisoli]